MRPSLVFFVLASTLCVASCVATSSLPMNASSSSEQSISISSLSASINLSSTSEMAFPYPIADGQNRIIKKQLGTYVTPTSSPVQPEKFTGFHTGLDFETLESEQSADVPISAICDGKVLFSGHVNGYGGVLVQSCLYKGEAVTVLYGHLKQASISLQKNDAVKGGETISVLGKGYSDETDFERKHLHLGMHKGTAIEYRGYVQNENELSEWIDPYGG